MRSAPHRAQAEEAVAPRKRSFRKFAYRGVDLEQLLELSLDDLLDLFHARARRKCAPSLSQRLQHTLCQSLSSEGQREAGSACTRSSASTPARSAASACVKGRASWRT